MRKVFVLRTGAIIASPDTTLRFGSDNTVVIPLAVLQHLYEYDGIPEKRRIASAFLDYISSIPREQLLSKEGFLQSNGSRLRVTDNSDPLDERIEAMRDFSRMDKRVFQTCLDLQMEVRDRPKKGVSLSKEEPESIVLISKNPSVRLKAAAIGVEAQTFKDELFPSPAEQYTGVITVYSSQSGVGKLFRDGFMTVEDIFDFRSIQWVENLFLQIQTENTSALGRFAGGKIYPLRFSEHLPNGYKALNVEQRMLWECLMAPPEIAPLVVVKGAAGTGKTFCALAMALEHLANYADVGIYDQILVATPTVTVSGERIGFLPGDIDEKVGPYLGGVMDNLKAIFREHDPRSDNASLRDKADELFDRGFIEIQPIGFLRGRTIPKTVFIIDETQNIRPSDIKDIVTRAARGSKFIFLGDPTQVNNPELNPRYNGLVYLSEKMRGNPLCWQITLSSDKSVRGDLAQAALDIL